MTTKHQMSIEPTIHISGYYRKYSAEMETSRSSHSPHQTEIELVQSMEPFVLRLYFFGDPENTNERIVRNEQSLPGPMDFFVPAVAEFVGTFIFVFCNTLSYMHTVNLQLTVSIIDGFTFYALTCILGRFSGAHFNPTQTLSVIFVGKCRLAIGIFMIFMQFLGAFFGAVYARCLLQKNTFAVAIYAATRWSRTDEYEINILQHFLLELTLSTLICCAYLFTAVINDGRNGAMCATVLAATRTLASFAGFAIKIGQTSNLARTVAIACTAYIFLSISDDWRLLYIPLLAHLASAPFSALIYWLSMKISTQNTNAMHKSS